MLYAISIDEHIAKTLYGDDDEEVTPQNSGTVEEPKFLGLYPGSNEKKLITAFNILLKNGPNGFYVQLGKDRKGCYHYWSLRKSCDVNFLPFFSPSKQLTSRDNLWIRYKGFGHACLV
ncbi:hypothetical protein CsSME_00051672 [Camellia sinensis var. sinensis]